MERTRMQPRILTATTKQPQWYYNSPRDGTIEF